MSAKSSSDIVSKAINESSAIKELALDAAKRELLEQLTPGIKRMIERELGQHSLSEDQDRLRRMRDGYGETEFEEGKSMTSDDKDLDMESIAGMFPSIQEADDEEMAEAKGDEEPDGDECPVDEADIPTLGEGDYGADDMDEEISISEAELNKMYRESLALERQLSEVQVSKGFKDMEQPTDEVPDSAGLHDVKSGEHTWDSQEPPAKKDWTVKEVKALVAQGINENKALYGKLNQLAKENKKLREHLAKVNLFNQKVLHVNKFFVEHKLSTKQQLSVVEAFDRAKTIAECTSTYKTLESSFRASGVVSESRSKAKANSQRARKPGATERVIRESVDKSANGDSAQYSRWQQLSGLKTIK